MKKNTLLSYLAIAVLMIGALTIYGFSQAKNFTQSQTFITVGIDNTEQNLTNNFEAADMFTETIQGWFKNTQFLAEINGSNKTTINAKKQEKQNLIISFQLTDGTDSETKTIQESVINTLKKNVENYNIETNSKVRLTLISSNITTGKKSYLPYTIIGIILSIASILFIENLKKLKKASS